MNIIQRSSDCHAISVKKRSDLQDISKYDWSIYADEFKCLRLSISQIANATGFGKSAVYKRISNPGAFA